uniref:Family with sequence similarity 98 member B n=1 Tax=Oncorhynchus kisutch TaxID=8019 RepID=A0A8C7MJE6_ONCKI
VQCEVIDSLVNLYFHRPLQTEEGLVRACEGGLLSTEYVNLCMWLASRLKPLCDLEENITSTFEMSGMLKELQCPYQGLVSGIIQEGLQNKKDYLKLVCKY